MKCRLITSTELNRFDIDQNHCDKAWLISFIHHWKNSKKKSNGYASDGNKNANSMKFWDGYIYVVHCGIV